MTVLEGLRLARERLLRNNTPLTAGYHVAMIDQAQAWELESELRGRKTQPAGPVVALPGEVLRVIGSSPVVAVLFGDLVVARVQR